MSLPHLLRHSQANTKSKSCSVLGKALNAHLHLYEYVCASECLSVCACECVNVCALPRSMQTKASVWFRAAQRRNSAHEQNRYFKAIMTSSYIIPYSCKYVIGHPQIYVPIQTLTRAAIMRRTADRALRKSGVRLSHPSVAPML